MRHKNFLLVIGMWAGVARTSLAGPVCPIEDQAHCQSAATGFYLLPSDRMLGIRRADDFRPAGSTITQLCFFPCFIGVTADGQGFDCFAEGETPPDDFILKIYEDSFGIPGTLVSGIGPNGLALTIDAKANSDPGSGSRCWRYSAPVAPPLGITVTPNECYWLEVTGMGEVQAEGTCNVNLFSSADGNNFSMGDDDDLYSPTDFAMTDCAFCVNGGLIGATNPPSSHDGGCGDFPVACCKAGPVCQDGGIYSQCVGTNPAPLLGIPFPFVTCAEIGGVAGCPIPANDLCQNAIYPVECQNQVPIANPGICELSGGVPPLHEPCNLDVGPSPKHDCIAPGAVCQPSGNESYHCQFETDNRFALTDGPNMQGGIPPTCFASGLDSLQADIWFRYIAPCDGYMAVINCRFASYDSMIQVFGNHTPTCPPCPISNNVQSLGCSDDNCSACCGESATEIRIDGIKEGACYLIRMGGYSQFGTPGSASQNQSGLDIGVVCYPRFIDMPTQAPPPHDRLKNRYISFVPNNAQNSVSFRVEKPSGSPGDCWVSAPDAAGNSKCVATPTFRTWGEPVIHVGDCEIMPVQQYKIRGFNADMMAMPDFLDVRTIFQPIVNNKFWGDVAGTNNGSQWTPPNFVTNVNDVLAVLAYISSAAIKPTFQVVNLQAISAADPCLNAFVNTADVLIVVKAAAGDAYPFTTNPANCPSCP